MYKGIVLHEMQLKAFLSIAAQEGLVCENGFTDGVFSRLTKYQPSYAFAKTILEKFCVAGSIYVNPYVYRVLDGKLIEEELIKPYEPHEEKKFDQLGYQYDPYMIQLMLAEKGYNIENYSIEHIRKSFYVLYKQMSELFDLQEKYPDVERLAFSKILGLDDPIYENEYIDHYSKLKDRITRNPIFQVLKEYTEIVKVAYYNDLLSSVNIEIETATDHDDKQTIKESEMAVRISKYTSNKMGSIIAASSINECIRLIQSAPAQAYREKVDEFLGALSKFDYDRMEVLDQEIENAKNAMKWSKAIRTTGQVVATAGAIGTAVSLIRPDSIVATGISCAATFAGVPLAFYDPTKQYLWASYGVV